MRCIAIPGSDCKFRHAAPVHDITSQPVLAHGDISTKPIKPANSSVILQVEAYFLEKKDMILPWPFGAPFFGFVVELPAELAGVVVFGLDAGGASSSENDSQAASCTVTDAYGDVRQRQ